MLLLLLLVLLLVLLLLLLWLVRWVLKRSLHEIHDDPREYDCQKRERHVLNAEHAGGATSRSCNHVLGCVWLI